MYLLAAIKVLDGNIWEYPILKIISYQLPSTIYWHNYEYSLIPGKYDNHSDVLCYIDSAQLIPVVVQL